MAAPSASTIAVTSDISTTTSPWPSLPDDLVRRVASLLLSGDLLDYVRFRAVCTDWRSSNPSPRVLGVVDPSFHPRRWMMFPEGDGLYPGHPKLDGHVRFFNLDTGAFVRVRIPLFDDHCTLDSVDGLLVLQRDDDTAVRLLHPFTGDVLDLPPLDTLLPQMKQDFSGLRGRKKLRGIRSVSTAATFVDGVVTVMLAFRHACRVAVATSRDRQWTMSPWLYEISDSPIASQGKIYVVDVYTDPDGTSMIYQMDTPLPDHQVLQIPNLIVACPKDKLCSPFYLVECDSEVLVIGHSDSSYSKPLVYKLADLVAGRYDVPVTSLGDKAIFIGKRTLSASSKALPTVEGDTIVYHHRREPYLAQYHIGSGTWSPAMDECSLSGLVPGPCALTHHILTCASRAFWNKGLLIHRKNYNGLLLRWPVKGELRHGA
ncbi:hypothetical protein EJB05_05283, partial [Eragrostis curvula]